MTTRPTTTMIPFFLPGDQVTHPSLPGKTLVVRNPKKTRAHVVPVNDLDARGWDAPMDQLSYATDGQGNRLPRLDLAAVAPTPPPVVSDLPLVGSLVRINRAWKHYSPTDLLVVIAVNHTTISVTKFGGEPHNAYARLGHASYEKADHASLVLAS